MPRKNGQAKRKSPTPAPTPTRTTSRRRTPQAKHKTPFPAISVPEVHQSPPAILPASERPEPAPEHETLLPAPPEASYNLPTPPGADAPEVAPRVPSLSPALAEELTAVWPDLQALAHWWQERHRLAQEDDTPERKLVRQTYHIEQRYIEAVRRESDRTGESYAAVVNRAFARYFAGR